MRYWNVVRLFAAIAAYLFLMAAVIWPVGMLKRLFLAAMDATPGERRRANARHNALWAVNLARVVRATMGFQMRIFLPQGWRGRPVRPRIYVANHRSVLDALVLPVVAWTLRNGDVRPVVKEELVGIPLLGSLFTGAGYGVVCRRKDRPGMDDEERRRLNEARMDEYYRHALEDGASVWLFPEGERFTGPKPGAARRHVGEPVGKKGFRMLCAHLPRHEVASVTLAWPATAAGKTMFESVDLCDRTVDVIVRLCGHVEPEAADRFLERDADIKERILAAQATRV
jgi:1-acyl-sn-glycerol-3-phosphate acyltransferase